MATNFIKKMNFWNLKVLKTKIKIRRKVELELLKNLNPKNYLEEKRFEKLFKEKEHENYFSK